MEELKIYIGYDSRESIAYHVAKHSILKNTKMKIDIVPIKQDDVRDQGIYWREEDKLASTEFTFTRYLIPHLNEYKGWALFIDCDFVALDDVQKLFDQRNNKYALMCAQHDYTPKPGVKMDGKQQTVYPRKNWSSMMLINCGHPENKKLDLNLINNPKTTGAYLHRFSWLDDSLIGKLSHEWNWLVGWYKEPEDGKPKFLHYTEGGPWFEKYADCEYCYEWYKVEREFVGARNDSQKQKMRNDRLAIKLPEYLSLPKSTIKEIENYIQYSVDPSGRYYGITQEHMMSVIQNKFKKGTTKTKKVAAIFNDDLNYDNRDYVYDEYLESLIIGTGGTLSNWEDEKTSNCPVIIRGVGKSSQLAIKHCWNTGRTFYAIDTGYFGNSKSKSKGWHRITKNNLQNLGPIIERPGDRLKMIGYNYRKFKDGRKILICPPSEKVMNLFGQPDPQTWTDNVIKELKQYTNRPIEVRLKPVRTERISTKSIESALHQDVHCLITYNSIAALEALMQGVPSIALGQNCATLVCNTKLSEIENLNRPDKETMYGLMCHLSYCQFTRTEMMNGYAWDIVNDSTT